MSPPKLDVITLGRSSVDLYGEQIGGRLEDMQSFAKYVGGCPTNIAVGTARLGLASGVITRVGDEQMGHFVYETLRAEGVDVSQVSFDPERLTALVILGIRDRGNFPHIFYRENCADMAIDVEHIDEGRVAASKALVITGTHLSTAGAARASHAAVAFAKRARARVVLDIDYRPVLWGLASAREGESRFVADAAVTAEIQQVLGECDLVVGTEEEIRIAGGDADTVRAMHNIRACSEAMLVVKGGPGGCWVFPDALPDALDERGHVAGFPVEVLNTLGAGDAFMSGFLRGWLRDETPENCGRLANACGALVVSRHGCAPAMPSWEELARFLGEPGKSPRVWEDAELDRIHAVTTRTRRWKRVCALAFDHRWQLEKLADAHGAPYERIERLKSLVAAGAIRAAEGFEGPGAIVDDRYGEDALATLTGRGWWIARPVEMPGSRPLRFDAGPQVGLAMRTWPREHLAKCLVSYHPNDDALLRTQQQDTMRDLVQACRKTGHELMLEVIPPPGNGVDAGTLPGALEQIYAAGIRPDWWKLQPFPDRDAWRTIAEIIARHDEYCRGVLLLGLDAPMEELERHFAVAAANSVCKGFAIGRSIFAAPAEAWFSGALDDDALVANVAENYRRLVELWQEVG